MNMQNLMAQAKKIQAEMEKETRELESKIFESENNSTKVIANGKGEILEININENLLDDKESLEDILMIVLNDVNQKIKTEKNNKLGKFTSGVGGLF